MEEIHPIDFCNRLSTIKVISSEDQHGKTRRKDRYGESWNVEKMKEGELDGSSTSRHFMSSSLESVKGGGSKTSKKSNDDVLGCWERRTRREEREFSREGTHRN